MEQKNIVWMEQVGMADVATVGGKNASLGEMISKLAEKGIRVPSGFVVTAGAYRYFLEHTGLKGAIAKELQGLDTRNLKDLVRRGKKIRAMVMNAKLPRDLEAGIAEAYREMEKRYGKNIDCAVRSSATAEDLPGASFAGEHETYLGIRGAASVGRATKSAMASLFNDRAISYRVDKGFDHFSVALSVGVQRMVRSDSAVSGVMFTVDTESGFRDLVIINGTWGLGELIVQGKVTPDEFMVFKKTMDKPGISPIISKRLGAKDVKMVYAAGKEGIKTNKIVRTPDRDRDRFTLTDEEVMELARWGVEIEKHYSARSGKWTPMDIEWAKDGRDGKLYIVQARPETVQAERDFSKLKEYILEGKPAKTLARGISVGSCIASGKARVILDAKHMTQFKKGEVLVTDMTDPDWEPIMKIASAIITDKGGRTSHAAIVSRELGIPAVVGCGNATRAIKTGTILTVDTTGTEGYIYAGVVPFKTVEHDISRIPAVKTKIMMNIATPDLAFEKSFLPNAGVGLAREEFIIASDIGIHPQALLDLKKLTPALRSRIGQRTRGWTDKVAFYTDNLAYGIAKIGAAFYPKPVIVRFSDFKTNEYRSLLGGELYEPVEENPMIGWRGASRYYDPKFRDAFALECKAMRQVRGTMGLTNVIPMIPFCRTLHEADQVLEAMKQSGLERGKDGLQVYMMCEIPSNVILAEEFLKRFDGYSIGSNDLSQLTLGLDRDSGIVNAVADERNDAVKSLIRLAIKKAKAAGKYIGICGQAPSDYVEFAAFLVEQGIDSMSLNPDTIIKTTLRVAETEKQSVGVQH